MCCSDKNPNISSVDNRFELISLNTLLMPTLETFAASVCEQIKRIERSLKDKTTKVLNEMITFSLMTVAE